MDDSLDIEAMRFAPSLLPYRAPHEFVALSTPGASRRVSPLHTGGMSSNARASRDEDCTPVPATVRGSLRCAADQSLHGFADGSSGCQGTGSLPALFVRLWLHPSCCSAKMPRILLTQDFGGQIADVSRFPQVESLFQLGVPVDTNRDFSKEDAITEAADQSPGLMTAHGSFETLCPSRGVARDQTSREWSSESSCLSRSVRTMFRMGQFGNGLSSKGSPGGTGCEL